jgi:hypothetical protein
VPNRALAERSAPGATVASAVGKRIVRVYQDGAVGVADWVVDEAAPALFDSVDMRAGVVGVLSRQGRI